MKVKALKSFGGTQHGHYTEGQIFELPDEVDWLLAGLVEPVEEKRETAMMKGGETATKPKRRVKRGKAVVDED